MPNVLTTDTLAFVARRLGVAIVDAFTAQQVHDPAIRIIPIDGAAVLPMFLNRHLSTPRSAIGTSFQSIAKASLRHSSGLGNGISDDNAPSQLA